EIAIGLLDQQAILEVQHVAAEGERVGVPALSFRFGGDGEEMRRLPDQIERDVGEAEIDLDAGRVTAPLAKPLAEDQTVVAKAKREFEQEATMRLVHRRVEGPAGADLLGDKFVFGADWR